ncbi:hypothetical protein [Streptomyces silvensis]|uniref:Uncharacterized protein n=1 Tax=Streptomyces silvensis TaxID=1765722 RepID=A0A0W7WRF7_9ACTN|nr:hypothetical protein [Streptomyces silvensis]KUF13064.1 hypothetical protein AT728_37665 [Streptomyces silvensis]
MIPQLHETAFDSKAARVGEVMGFEGPYVQLRPLRGGLEWDAKPEDLSPAVPLEWLASNRASLIEEWGR